jgi:hypothetical protein
MTGHLIFSIADVQNGFFERLKNPFAPTLFTKILALKQHNG